MEPALIMAKTEEENNSTPRLAMPLPCQRGWRGLGRRSRHAETLKSKVNTTRMPRATPPSAPSLFGDAMAVVRSQRRNPPEQKRLPEDPQRICPSLGDQSWRIRRPVCSFRKLTLTFSLTKLREILGPDDPFCPRILR